jgi:heat shock protein HslJ
MFDMRLTSILVLVLVGTMRGDSVAQTPGSLEGTAWNAVELAGMPVPPQKAPDRQPHLVFDAKGRLSGADGCNRLTGPFTVKADAISFGEIAGTLMACPGTDEIAKRFRAALKGTSHWRIVKDRLEFYGATGKPLAIFERRAAASPSSGAPLQGTTWRLVRFQGGDGRTLTPDDPEKYTIEFGADGRLAARVDCNRGRGTWKTSGPSQLEFGPLALTRAQCPPGSLHDQIAKQWTFVRSYMTKNGHLFLSLMADGGIYEFEPVAKKQP